MPKQKTKDEPIDIYEQDSVQPLLSLTLEMLKRIEIQTPKEKRLSSNSQRFLINLITCALLSGFFISLAVLLFSTVTVGACVAFIVLTIAIVVTLVLLARS